MYLNPVFKLKKTILFYAVLCVLYFSKSAMAAPVCSLAFSQSSNLKISGILSGQENVTYLKDNQLKKSNLNQAELKLESDQDYLITFIEVLKIKPQKAIIKYLDLQSLEYVFAEVRLEPKMMNFILELQANRLDPTKNLSLHVLLTP